ADLLHDRRRVRREDEAADLDVEAAPVRPAEQIAALHRAPVRRDRAAARVLVGRARLDPRELADDARSADVLPAAVAVDDDPVSRLELRGFVALVRDADAVDEDVPP